jgi:hypothetical protein
LSSAVNSSNSLRQLRDLGCAHEELASEKKYKDELLANILPQPIADELKKLLER